MKTHRTTLNEASAAFVKDHLDQVVFLTTFNRSEKHVRYTFQKKLKGVYLICKSKVSLSDTACLYVGHTTECVWKRMSNHKKSLNSPDWKVEWTGRMFIDKDIPLDQDMDLYFIGAEDLGVSSKHEFKLAESMFIEFFKPSANS